MNKITVTARRGINSLPPQEGGAAAPTAGAKEGEAIAMADREKICFIASSGGHVQEVSWLFDLQEGYDAFLVTEQNDFKLKYPMETIYYFNKIDRREKHFFLHFLRLIKDSAVVMHREKPDIIVSTGALVAVPMMYIGKLLGKRVIYMESLARVEGKSLTGKLAYPIADLFIVQWETMLAYYPKAVYASKLFGEVKNR